MASGSWWTTVYRDASPCTTSIFIFLEEDRWTGPQANPLSCYIPPPPTRFLLSVSKDVTIELCLVFSRLLIIWLLECRYWHQNSSSSEAFIVYFAYPDEEICCLLCKFLHFLSSWCNRDVRDEWVGFRDMMIVLVSSFFPAMMMKYDVQVSCGDICLLVDSLLWQSWSTRSLLVSPWTDLSVAAIETVAILNAETISWKSLTWVKESDWKLLVLKDVDIDFHSSAVSLPALLQQQW